MQTKLESLLEIAKGTAITLTVTGICNLIMPIVWAFVVSLVVSTLLKYALRRYYNRRVSN